MFLSTLHGLTTGNITQLPGATDVSSLGKLLDAPVSFFDPIAATGTGGPLAPLGQHTVVVFGAGH